MYLVRLENCSTKTLKNLNYFNLLWLKFGVIGTTENENFSVSFVLNKTFKGFSTQINTWRLWSNGYDVWLWSARRGFDSLLSPLDERW